MNIMRHIKKGYDLKYVSQQANRAQRDAQA